MSISQKEFFETYFPYLMEYGFNYFKYSLVLARRAEPGEYIETWTADGLETTNYAKKDDFVVKNLQTEYQEEYIIPSKIFYKRYMKLYDHEEGSIYKPTGKIKASVFHGSDTEFVAKWGRLMILKTGDFIVSPCPNFQEVYRIARKEFFETYEEDL
jgi:MoaA/NifB/PqqE/SkfB family radical SAM enzyme